MAFQFHRAPLDPTLLYRVWTARNPDKNSRNRFRSGISVKGTAPKEEEWDEIFLRQAAAHLNHETDSTPFVSLTQILLLALRQAIRAQINGVNLYITLIEGNLVKDNLIPVDALYKAIEEKDLGHFDGEKNTITEEWLYWGTLKGYMLEDNTRSIPAVTMGTIKCWTILRLADSDPAVGDVMHINEIQKEKSVMSTYEDITANKRQLNVTLSSALGTLGKTLHIEEDEMDDEIICQFCTQCEWSFALVAPPPEEEEAINDAFFYALYPFS
ncbi:MAG: hypothetical protein M1820_010489 [Bogoriella megaspora]|nr:MAG: hypothetical protein M1820_010489 [Bogoriella megaspora]